MHRFERRPLSSLVPYARNSRTHSPQQVEQLKRSIQKFGFTNPALIDEAGHLIAGHGRVLAVGLLGASELARLGLDVGVPCVVLVGLTDAQRRAYVIADNQLALNAGWNEDLLRAELEALALEDFDLDLLGFKTEDLEELLKAGTVGGGAPTPGAPGPAEPGESVPPDAVAISAPGDVWILGAHRVMCGDSCDPGAVTQLLAGAVAQLVHADPPYGMGKEADGVANDNLYGAKLDAFQIAWWQSFRPHLQGNASVYVWGNAEDLWRLWYAAPVTVAGADGDVALRGLAYTEPLTLRNEIVWDKKSIAGMASPDLTKFPEASERCLFFTLGRYVFQINQTKDDYWPGWEPLRLWLCEQRDLAGWRALDVKRICGNHMAGHWFGMSQWAFISRENYAKLAEAAAGVAFTRPYEELFTEFKRGQQIFNGDIRDDRAADFRAARPYFDNAHAIMRDTWEFSRVSGEDRLGHATPKPVEMMERVMLSSLRPGELCVEPFGGSGPTLIAAEKTGRKCYSMELVPEWVDVIVRRWQRLTGLKAVRESDGLTFDAVAAAEDARLAA